MSTDTLTVDEADVHDATADCGFELLDFESVSGCGDNARVEFDALGHANYDEVTRTGHGDYARVKFWLGDSIVSSVAVDRGAADRIMEFSNNYGRLR